MPERFEQHDGGEPECEPKHGGLFEHGVEALKTRAHAVLGSPMDGYSLKKERLSEGKRRGDIWAIHRVWSAGEIRTCFHDAVA